MRIEILIFPIYIIVLLLVGGCIQNDGGVKVLSGLPFESKVKELSEEEIKSKQNDLRKIHQRDDVAYKTESTSVFIGEVIEKGYVPEINAIKAKIAISKVMWGLKDGAVLVDVYTPLSKYGIGFEIGKPYKILAVEMRQVYWTWIWLGTYQIRKEK